MKINMKQLTPVLLVLAAVFLLFGIVLFAFLVPGASSTFYRVCLILIAILSLAIGLGILYVLYLGRDNDPNFFLYDTRSGRNMDAGDLTFDRVNSRMSYFMTTLTTSQEKLWRPGVLDPASPRFGTDAVYLPLAAYKMLYDLVEIDTPEGWALFLGAAPEVIDSLCAALRKGGEEAMANSLVGAYNEATSREDSAWLRDFLTGNEKYLKKRMMGYVMTHMEWFY